MRKNFAQVLSSANVDIKKEYSRLYDLLYRVYDDRSYDPKPLYEEFNDGFSNVWFRKTAITLDDFNESYGFCFDENPQNLDIDYLVSFCEYFYNLAVCFIGMPTCLFHGYLQFVLQQINKVIASVGYMSVSQDNLTVFVERSPAAVAVSEIIEDENLSYKTIYYNHFSMKGNIEAKKEILLKFANLLEPKGKILCSINPSLKKDLFYMFNNLNIRHNNIDSNDKSNYKKYVSEMASTEIEEWYDETYQMCLLALLEIEHVDRKRKLETLQESINGSTN